MTYRFIDEKGEHLHELDGQPLHGTSTLIGEVMPPFLAKWGGQCAVDYIKENSNGINPVLADGSYKPENLEEQLAEAREKWRVVSVEVMDKAVTAYTKVGKKAMQKGTDLHKELEEYVTEIIIKYDGKPTLTEVKDMKVLLFAQWAVKNIEKFVFAEAHTYSRELWVGGIVDCGAILKDGTFAIIDFKSGKVAYFSSFLQVAGYALQIEETGWGDNGGGNWQKLSPTGQNGATGDIPDKVGALIIVPFGNAWITPVIIRNVEGFKEAFRQIKGVFDLQRAFKNR